MTENIDRRTAALTEAELYRELGALTRNRNEWEAQIPTVSSLLASDSVKIRAKALWLLGEMGLQYPESVAEHVPAAAAYLDSAEPLLRERALHALGRIGRGSRQAVEPFWNRMFAFAADEAANVRLSFIWASENIAANTPEPYGEHMTVFAGLLHDPDDRVRMEAPEMFRVLGKRRPEFVRPYIGLLRTVAETDLNRVVRIHCAGAIRAAES
jgi:HEAT repeat protein